MPFLCSAQQLPAYADAEATAFFRRTNGLIACDGGFNVPLRNGSSLWLMGDSHIDDFDAKSGTVPCLFQVRNAALLQAGKSWTRGRARTLTGKGPGIKSYIKNSPADSLFCWPFSGIQLGDTVYVYNAGLRKTNDGAFGFAPAGADFWAKITYPDMQVQAFAAIGDFGGINFGSGFIRRRGDKFIYAYGFRFNRDIMGCEVFVARFAEANPTQWTFWDGKNWQADVKKARMLTSQKNVSGTLQVSQVNGRLIMLTSAFSMDCDMGTDIYVSTSANITGPFSKPKAVYSIPDRREGHSPFFYAANLHPHHRNTKGDLLITYAVNGYGKCLNVCRKGRMDPDTYRLKAIRIPVKTLLQP